MAKSATARYFKAKNSPGWIGLKDSCGFCGEVGKCHIEIAKGSGKGKTASEVPRSGCDYFVKFSIVAAAKGSKKSPCTNRPVRCQICKRTIWSYNMYHHIDKCHSDYSKDEWVIKEEEKIALSKIKWNGLIDCELDTLKTLLYTLNFYWFYKF